MIAEFHARRTCRAGRDRGGRVGDHDAIVELPAQDARATPTRSSPSPRRSRRRSRRGANVRFVRKDTEQVHVTLGGLGLQRGDERRFAARVLDAIFGGLSSSRLFQAVREERGLAYSVYSFAGQYADTGQVGLYVGTRPDNIVEAMQVVSDELERLREEPATEAELMRASATSRAGRELSTAVTDLHDLARCRANPPW